MCVCLSMYVGMYICACTCKNMQVCHHVCMDVHECEVCIISCVHVYTEHALTRVYMQLTLVCVNKCVHM